MSSAEVALAAVPRRRMFKIRSFPKKNLKWWHGKAGSIDLDPDFQRTSRVWKGRDQTFLIDSILNGFDIPKLYIADFTKHDVPELNIQKKSYAVIDGKQRLTAIFGFMDDNLQLPKKYTVRAHPTVALGGLTFSELKSEHPEIAEAIEKYVPDVKSIETNDRSAINDVFLRLNKTAKALNGAEMRNAVIGKAVDAIRVLVKNPFFAKRISFNTNRSQEKNTAAKILLLEYEGNAFVDTKKRNLDSFVERIGRQTTSQFNGALKRVKKNLDVLSQVFQNGDGLLHAEGHVPLYYMFITRLPENDQKKVRAFLEEFERERIKNRNSGAHNRDLDGYDLASRSTNDKKSFETRLRVIRKKFAAWKRAPEPAQ